MKKTILICSLVLAFSSFLCAQVQTNFNNGERLSASGKFRKNFASKAPYVIPARDITALMAKELAEDQSTPGAKPFRIAEPVVVDIDVVKEACWTEENGFAFGKFTVKAASAKSISANFDNFHLPAGTELHVYSENGEMITGPVTEEENNKNNFWGTWVYKGDLLTVDLKTPVTTKQQLKLHMSNVAYGYKDIYAKVGYFGASGSCNINVLCPEGNGWQYERNAVALLLRGDGSALCSGAMINNLANQNIPYLLTANHCFEGDSDVAHWKFTFQAWSPTCTPSENATGITFNGSVLRARSAYSDFCLVELSQQPPLNSMITYAGWNRSNLIFSSATGIHHPSGDVMKISTSANQLNRTSYLGAGGTSNHWKVYWSKGVTEGGSSGSPLFDVNHRIIGQLHGGYSACGGSDLTDYYGCFDLSWSSGSSSASRLKEWLDPGNLGRTTCDTRSNTNIAVSAEPICTSANFTLTNPPTGIPVTWSSDVPNSLSINQNTGVATRLNNYNGFATITATVGINVFKRVVNVGVGGLFGTIQRDSGAPTPFTGSIGGIFFGSPTPSTTIITLQNILDPATTYAWTASSPQGSPTYNFAGSKATVTLAHGSGINLSCKITNSCGNFTTTINMFNYSSGSAASTALSAYPNPATNQLTVEIANDEANKSAADKRFDDGHEVVLTNALGVTRIAKANNGKADFNLNGVPPGLYFVKVTLHGKQIVQKIQIDK